MNHIADKPLEDTVLFSLISGENIYINQEESTISEEDYSYLIVFLQTNALTFSGGVLYSVF